MSERGMLIAMNFCVGRGPLCPIVIDTRTEGILSVVQPFQYMKIHGNLARLFLCGINETKVICRK